MSADAVRAVRPGGTLVVPQGARLTPLARDLMEEHGVRLEEVTATPAVRAPSVRVRIDGDAGHAPHLEEVLSALGASVERGPIDRPALPGEVQLVLAGGVGYEAAAALIARGIAAAPAGGAEAVAEAWVAGFRTLVLGVAAGEGAVREAARTFVALEAGWEEDRACSSDA